MNWRAVIFVCGAVCLSIEFAEALPPRSQSSPAVTLSPGAIDYDKYVNANKLLGLVSNQGHLFYDIATKLGRTDGLYYPYTSVADILNGTNIKTVVYAAGLWMGGLVGPDTLVSVAEYGAEYISGNMIGGTYDPDYSAEKYRVYKLYRDSMAANPNSDYLQWPVAQGAPLDGAGHPLLLGDQTAWCVYNDAYPQRHTNHAGSSSPLGIEVRQTVWSSNDFSESNVINVKYQFFNRGPNPITDFHISFWADMDLGDPSDDLVGCDTLQDIFFAYNAFNTDAKYGSEPPAWGGKLLIGPIVPSPGDSAMSFGQIVHGYRNLGMTAFSRYINGSDPTNHFHSYNYMCGLNQDGSPHVYNGQVLTYMHSGDPVSQSGDLDHSPTDCRLMASCGPITFNPGDSQEVIFRIAAISGHDRLQSVTLLRQSVNGTIYPDECSSIEATVSNYGALADVLFYPDDERWISGVRWGAELFNRSCGHGADFWGSRLDPVSFPDSFPNVALRFSHGAMQRGYRYVAPDYAYGGYVNVPFTVWDIDHNRQVNVAFVEQPDSRVFDSTWSLDDREHYGGREYLFVLNSTYSGNQPTDASPVYTGKNIKTDAPTLDILYGAWLTLDSGHVRSEMQDGQTLLFKAQSRNHNGLADSVYFPETELGTQSIQPLQLQCAANSMAGVYLTSSNPAVFSVAPRNDYPPALVLQYVAEVREMSNGFGHVEPPSGRNVLGQLNSTGDWSIQLNPAGGNLYGNIDGHDFEIRFTPTGSLCYDRTGYMLLPGRVPFEVWDIDQAADANPADDQRVAVSMRDDDQDDVWDVSEPVYFLSEPYSEQLPASLDLNWVLQGKIQRVIINAPSGLPPVGGTVVRFLTTKFNLSARPYMSFEDFSDGLNLPQNAALRPDDFTTPWDIVFAPTNPGQATGIIDIHDSLTGQVKTSLAVVGSTPPSCCQGIVGNLDCDPQNVADIADLTALIDYLYIAMRRPCCLDASRIDGPELPDIGDITMLIDHLFISFVALRSCP